MKPVSVVKLLKPERVVAELHGQSKREALAELCDVLAKSSKGKIGDSRTLLQALMEREKLGTTGIGDGIAVPHAKLSQLGDDDPIIAIGRSQEGVEYEAMDGNRVHLIVVLLSPNNPKKHLQALAAISRLLHHKKSYKKLMHAEDAKDIYAKLESDEKQFLVKHS